MWKSSIEIIKSKINYWVNPSEVYRWKINGGGPDPFKGTLKGDFSIPIDVNKFEKEMIIARARRKGRTYYPFNFSRNK